MPSKAIASKAMFTIGQGIVARLDTCRWPVIVTAVFTDSIRVQYAGDFTTTIRPSEVVSDHHPFDKMPLHLPICAYETAVEYEGIFYVKDWGKKDACPLVEWKYDPVNKEFTVLIVENGEIKEYTCDKISTPVLTDDFTEEHTQTKEKQLVNNLFAACIKEVDPHGRLPVYILDTGNTTSTLRAADVSNPIVVINPDDTLVFPDGVEHFVGTFHEFMRNKFIQDGYKEGHVGLDLCGELAGNKSSTLPKADLKSLLECVLTNDTILWVTFNMRHLKRAKRETHIDDVYRYLQEQGEPLGFSFILKHSLRYGTHNDMVYLIIHVKYENKHAPLSTPGILPKRKPKKRNFLEPGVENAKRAR